MTVAVQLRRDVHDLGRAGQIVNVNQAYARNFLIPKGLAVLATPKVVAAAKHHAATQMAEQAKLRAAEEQAKTDLAGVTIRLTGRASSSGKLFAAIKSDQVISAVEHQTGRTLRSSATLNPSVLKTIGDHNVTLMLAGTPVLFTVHIDHADN